ncbi:hypothetical protein ACQCVP_11125 [Rossellomorea vietnamensis]
MFQSEKKAVFPFIRFGLFDPEGLSPFQWVRTLRRWNWTGTKSGSALISPDRQMFQSEKKAVFPFIRFGLFDPEGLGAGTGRPLAPQEIASLQRRSSYVKGDEGKRAF